MSVFIENTGEAWMRNVNKRLAQLERLPRSGNATISAGDLTSDTSVAFEADVLLSAGVTSDPSLGAMEGTPEQDGTEVDFPEVDPYAIEDYDDPPLEATTPLQFAPVTPSDPYIESRASGIAVIWDGMGAGGEQVPQNVLLVEVHRSLDPLFEPDETSYAGSFLDAGVMDFRDQEYEIPWYYRFVLLTNEGLRSTPSNAVEGTAHKIAAVEVGFSASAIDFDNAISNAATAAANAEATAAAVDAEVNALTITVGSLETAVAGKTKTFAQASIPTSTTIGDIWVDTDDNNRTYWASTAGATTIGVGGWQEITPATTTGAKTYYQPTAPATGNEGDLWFDSDDGNKQYRWGGTLGATARTNLNTNPSFETNTAGYGGNAITLTRDNAWAKYGSWSGKMVPSAANADSWISIPTPPGGWVPGTTYTVSATIYIPVVLTGTTINRERRMLIIGTAGVGFTAESNIAPNVVGETRLKVTFTVPIGNTAVSARIYNGYQNTATNAVYYDGIMVETGTTDGTVYFDGSTSAQTAWTGTAHASTSTYTPGWTLVTAPSGTQTFAQNGIPTSTAIGDLWIDTDDANKLYRAASVGATTIAAGAWVLVSTVSVKTFAQNGIPTSTSAGDLWVDTDDSNKTYRAFAAGVNTIGPAAWVLVDNTAFAAATTLVQGWVYPGQTTINGGLIHTDTILATSIGTDQILARHVKAGEITAVKMATGTITAASGVIGSLSASVITVGTLDTARIAAGTIATVHLAAGSITTAKIALPTFNRNMVADPSFEESYTIAPAGTDTDVWRTTWLWAANVERATRARSGRQTLRMNLLGNGSKAQVISNVMAVTPGRRYTVAVNVAKGVNTTGAEFSARIAGGSTTALTEYPAITELNDIDWSGEDPAYVEKVDPKFLGYNELPDFVDDDANGIADGATAYVSGTVTTGVRSFAGTTQTLSAASMAVSSRWGILYTQTGLQRLVDRRVEGSYTLSGTNARLRVTVDYYDTATSTLVGSATQVYSAASGVFSVSVPTADADEYRVHLFLEPAAGLTATTAAATVTMPYMHRVDPLGTTWPPTPTYSNYTGEFVCPAGINWVALHLTGETVTSPGAQQFYVDDISLLEWGLGGSELTSAGLRLFDNDGEESAAFVSNRPNYFTVTDNGTTLASVSALGDISGQTLSIAGRDTDGDGIPDSGVTIYGRDFSEWVSDGPKGLQARAQRGTASPTTTTTESKYLQLGFVAYPGRAYKIAWFAGIQNSLAGGRSIVRIRYTTNGSAPSTSSTELRGQRVIHSQATQTQTAAGSKIFSVSSVTDYRFLMSFVGETGTVNMTATSDNQNELWIEDMGPWVTDTGIDVDSGTPPPSKVTATTTWTSTGWAMYQQSGARKTNADDIKQGYSSYDGDAKGLWTFPSMTSTLSGSTISKVEVYLYANHWHYDSGGTALIDLHDRTSPPSNWSSVTRINGVNSAKWPKPGGRWVTIPNTSGTLYSGLISGAWRGVAVGPAGTTNLLYYGRFNGSGAKIRVTYTK